MIAEKQRVRVRDTGKLGTISAVMPDAAGAPYCVHVKLDEEVAEGRALPLVLAPDEFETVEPIATIEATN